MYLLHRGSGNIVFYFQLTKRIGWLALLISQFPLVKIFQWFIFAYMPVLKCCAHTFVCVCVSVCLTYIHKCNYMHAYLRACVCVSEHQSICRRARACI